MITTINNKHNKLNVPNSTDKGNAIRNLPNLRFPEFREKWEEHELSEYLDFKNGLNPKPNQFGKGIKFISVMDILNNAVITYDCIRASVSVSEEDMSAFSVQKGDILFQRSSETLEDVGRANVYVDDIPAVFGGFVIRGKQKTNYNPLFFKYLLSSPLARKRIIRMGAGAQHFNIGQEGLSKVKLPFACIDEQNKIAKILYLLDKRISLQNKIIDKLQTLIKGMEDNLLDNPLWEKTYLRSFMQFFPTNSLSWEQLSYKEGAIRNLHYGLIHGLQTRGINSVSLPMIKNEAIPKQYTLCQVGDVAFADASEDTGEIAKSVEFVDTIEGDTICGLHTIHGRDIKNRTVVGFKGFAFNSRYFHNQIKRLAQGTKVFSITANNLSSCYVYLPDLETQKAIVNLLKTYEAKLLVSKRLLEHYEKQKQYLLRQMFI